MKIPEYINRIITKFEDTGFEAFIVGGCVRDLLMGREPKDWDITTKARPEEILRIFPDGKYENVFGTVLVQTGNKEHGHVVEVTTYRSERGYSDRRHPDEIVFEDALDKDLERRDFTVNAMALGRYKTQDTRTQKNPKPQISNSKSPRSGIPSAEQIQSSKFEIQNFVLVDLFGGQKDVGKKIIRAVGEPVDRFKEDALRMMRAVRLACELGFSVEPKTERGIVKMSGSIKFMANERIRDELIKILVSDRPYDGLMLLHNLKLLQYIIPELERGKGIEQSGHHTYSVFKHSAMSLKHCPGEDWRVRLAALMHDVAKPHTKRIIKGDVTFYNHDIVGARITRKVMRRLRFTNDDIDKVTNLVRHHMFYYNVDEVTASSVRRLICKVGYENLKDLIDLRIADRLGSGVPKAKPYKIRHLEYMFKRVQNDPVSVKMLKINGDDLMKLLNMEPGPKIGAILDVLLSDVIEDPKLNNKKYLEERARELDKMDLNDLRDKARETIEDKKIEDDQIMKKEFWVK